MYLIYKRQTIMTEPHKLARRNIDEYFQIAFLKKLCYLGLFMVQGIAYFDSNGKDTVNFYMVIQKFKYVYLLNQQSDIYDLFLKK